RAAQLVPLDDPRAAGRVRHAAARRGRVRQRDQRLLRHARGHTAVVPDSVPVRRPAGHRHLPPELLAPRALLPGPAERHAHAERPVGRHRRHDYRAVRDHLDRARHAGRRLALQGAHRAVRLVAPPDWTHREIPEARGPVARNGAEAEESYRSGSRMGTSSTKTTITMIVKGTPTFTKSPNL